MPTTLQRALHVLLHSFFQAFLCGVVAIIIYIIISFISDLFTQTVHLVMYTSRAAPSLTSNPRILTVLLHNGVQRRGHFHHSLIGSGTLFSKGWVPLLNVACHKLHSSSALSTIIMLFLFYFKWVN